MTDTEINDYLRAHARYELARMAHEEMMAQAGMYYPAVSEEYQDARMEFKRACEWVRGH